MKRHALTLIGNHVLSTLSAIWVISNLLVWLSLLILTLPALLVLKPLGREGALEPWIGWIYQSAVRIDSFWMLRVVGIQLEVKGEVRGDLRARLVAHRRRPEGYSYEDRAGEVLPAHLEALDGAHADYARRAGDDLGLYAQEGLVHPCTWPALANAVFVRHLVDGPWIHTRSRIVHHAAVAVGEPVLVEATVVDRLEGRRGTRVVVDVEVSLDGFPAASVRHEALVHLRP